MNGKRGDLVYAKACRVRKTEEHHVLRHSYEIFGLVAFIEKRKQENLSSKRISQSQ